MFNNSDNKQYTTIAKGDFADSLVKVPKYERTSKFFGTKEFAIEQGIYLSGSSNFFFVAGLESPILNEYLSQQIQEPKVEIRTNAMSKNQWEELKSFVDSLY